MIDPKQFRLLVVMPALQKIGLWSDDRITNTNTPGGATAYSMRVYDQNGANIGYIPVYGANW